MKRLRAFFKQMPGGHRPPTGPLTTAEANEAEELRHEALAAEEQRVAHEPDEAGAAGDPDAPPASGD